MGKRTKIRIGDKVVVAEIPKDCHYWMPEMDWMLGREFVVTQEVVIKKGTDESWKINDLWVPKSCVKLVI